jgi:hypothetical protein
MAGMSGDEAFTDAERGQLAERGIDPAEAGRQLALMADPPGYARLERPCTRGDGIERLDERRLPALLEAHAACARAGRVSSFVPASGAATRMFKELLAALSGDAALLPGEVRAESAAGLPEARVVAAFVDGLPRFAFHEALEAVVRARGESPDRLRESGPWRPLLEALLQPDGLDYARLPKGLLAFHQDAHGPSTAFEEHLSEAGLLARDAQGACRLDFTVSPEHRARFEALLASASPALARRLGVTFDVRFSEQHPATDTLAGDPGGGPFRDSTGRLHFRPAGHGALLRNLAGSRTPLVLVKNIDNVAVERLRPETARWGRALLGLAAVLHARAHGLLARLADARDRAAPGAAQAFARILLGEADPPRERAALVALLDRPLRVCGMVPNTGEPGGGPFWVRGRDGRVTRQVVESAQIDPDSAEQRSIAARATHFNPVFFACSLRDGAGEPYPLEDERFLDPEAVIVTRKSAEGRELLALERPGLWNGAMAHWTTLFVEVPLAVFNPVKTVLDLLRPEHQG